MLFATKIAWTYTGKSISHLTKIVRDLDWLNMVHMFKYDRGTKYIPLVLISNKSVVSKCYIGGSYAVHPNMMGHTDGGLTMGEDYQYCH